MGTGAFRAGRPEQRVHTPHGPFVDNRSGCQNDRMQDYERRNNSQSEQDSFLHRRQVSSGILLLRIGFNLILLAIGGREQLRGH